MSDEVSTYLHAGGDGQVHTPEVAALQHQVFLTEQAEHMADIDHDLADEQAKQDGGQPARAGAS